MSDNTARAAALKNAEDFVRTVITEIYGQTASAKLIKSTAKRVVAALPAAPSEHGRDAT